MGLRLNMLLQSFELNYVVGSRDVCPQSDTSNLYNCHEWFCIFCITCCNAPPTLEMQEGIFYQMPQFVERFIILPLIFAIFSWWNNWHHPLRFYLIDNILTAIPRSARRFCAVKPSINLRACMQSAVVPWVTAIRTGIPCASTAKCSFVLSPLLCDSYLDCHL